MGKNIGLFVFTLLLVTGCSDEAVIQQEGFQAKPVIYCMIDARDSVHLIRLGRFFSGYGAPPETARIPDSIYFRSSNLTVTLENGRGKRVIVPVEHYLVPDKDSGFFDSDPYEVYWFYTKMISGYPGVPLYSKICIDINIPGLPLAKCSTSIVSPPIIWSPKRAQQYIYVFPDNPMRVLFSGGAWNEIDVTFQIMEQYQDTTIIQTFTAQKTTEVHINEQYYELKTPYELVLQILEQNLKVNQNVVRRYFGPFRIDIHDGNEDFNNYIKFIDGINDFNHNPYFNIENGVGFISSKSTTIKTVVYLDQVSRLKFASEPALKKFRFIEY